jgi:DeoR family deoxyribose operon repressor
LPKNKLFGQIFAQNLSIVKYYFTYLSFLFLILLAFYQYGRYDDKIMGRRQERIARIVQTLQINRPASIRELAGILEVSEITIRRDLDRLARDNIIRFMHAGAVLNPEIQPSIEQPRYSLTEAGATHADVKMRIGRKAASLIEAGDIVIVDSGSTTEYVARSIPAELPLTVLCFALNILVEARRKKECRLIFCGGTLHGNTLMFESPEGVQMVRRYRANKAFISAYGVSEKLGVTCANSYEVEIKKAALASSLTRILVADSSKFGKIQPAWFADLGDFDAVISDTGLPDPYREVLRERGITLHLA